MNGFSIIPACVVIRQMVLLCLVKSYEVTIPAVHCSYPIPHSCSFGFEIWLYFLFTDTSGYEIIVSILFFPLYSQALFHCKSLSLSLLTIFPFNFFKKRFVYLFMCTTDVQKTMELRKRGLESQAVRSCLVGAGIRTQVPLWVTDSLNHRINSSASFFDFKIFYCVYSL